MSQSVSDSHPDKEASSGKWVEDPRANNAFESSETGMVFVSMEGAIFDVNPAFCEFLGYTRDELLALDFQAITHPDDLEADFHEARKLLAGEIQAYTLEKRYLHKSGRAVWGLLTVSGVRDQASNIHYFVSQIRDIDKIKNAQDELLASQRRLEAATLVGRIGIWEIDLESQRLALNNVAREILDFDGSFEPAWEHCKQRIHPDDQAPTRDMVRRFFENNESFEAELRIVLPSGDVRWVQVSQTPLRGPGGDIIGGAGTIIDTTSKKQEAEQRRIALEMAEAAAYAKSDFLARMSHEIRTPMNAILAPAQLISETKLDNAQRDLVTMIQRAGEHLLDVINTILDFSKLEAGKMPLNEETFHMETVLDEVLAPFSIIVDNKETTLTRVIDADAGGYWVGDISRIRQILLNLVSNAVKFTVCGEVEVRVSRWQGEQDIGSGLQIQVRDTGTGLSLQETERIFLPFEQSPVGASRRPGGTGLGLAICRELVDLMGGILGVESTPGEGSKFWFCIPLKEANGLPESAETPPEVGQDDALWNTPPNVMVVEDNPSNRKVISLLLRKMGCLVSVTSDGQQALAALALSDFDLIFMDCEMPVMDGYECAKEIRRREEMYSHRVPLLALSAHVTPEHNQHCLECGMDEVLAKPISSAELRKAIQRWVPANHSPLAS
ncbi:MAG: PAS domain S-box protein [Terrimicrobiaceae bacterium]